MNASPRAKTTSEKVPVQKSNSSKAPPGYSQTHQQPSSRVPRPNRSAERLREILYSSSKKARIGCPMARDEVMPAKNSSPNHMAPAIGANHPQLPNSVGRVRKTRPRPRRPAGGGGTARRPGEAGGG